MVRAIPSSMNADAKTFALSALTAVSLAATAQQQVVKPPQAQAWIDVAT